MKILFQPSPYFFKVEIHGSPEERIGIWRSSLDPRFTRSQNSSDVDFSELLILSDALVSNNTIWFSVLSPPSSVQNEYATVSICTMTLDDFGIKEAAGSAGQKHAINALEDVFKEANSESAIEQFSLPLGPALRITTNFVTAGPEFSGEITTIPVVNIQTITASQNCSALAIVDFSCAYPAISVWARDQLDSLLKTIDFQISKEQ